MALHRHVIVATAVLGIVGLAPEPALADPARSDPLTFNWNAFGTEISDGMPTSVRTRLDQLRFVSDAVGSKIRQQGISPNVSVIGRGISGVTHGDLSLGTCDDVSESLRDALQGAGVAPDDVMLLVARRSSPVQGKGLDLVNMSHAALVVFVDHKPYVFDLWLHGATTGAFSDFSSSTWSALDPAVYLSTLKKWGYQRFNCHGCADPAQRSAEDFLRFLKAKTILDEAREAASKQGKPRPATPPTGNPPSMRDTHDAYEGKLACARLMQGIVKEKESEDAVYGKYWVVFTRPYTYENGACVGAHQIWRKKPDGSPPYAEVEYYSPENPARIPVDEIKK